MSLQANSTAVHSQPWIFTHQSAVDVGLGHELVHGFRGHAAAVLDAHGFRRLGGVSLGEPRPDVLVHVLGDFGGRRQAGADRPHGLVRNHHLAQLLFFDTLQPFRQLHRADLRTCG